MTTKAMADGDDSSGVKFWQEIPPKVESPVFIAEMDELSDFSTEGIDSKKKKKKMAELGG